MKRFFLLLTAALPLSWSADGESGWYPEIYDLFEVSEYANDYVIDWLGAGHVLTCSQLTKKNGGI